ncbi:MAG: ferritin-like domain-containing protein [Pyrinomonadaceae bacterium]
MELTGTRRAMEDMGGNLSGIQTAPELAKEQIEGAAAAGPNPDGGPEIADSERATYIEEGFPIGSLPDLPFADEETADEEATGMAVFLDKLGERLAFERMGTRLYDALINKCETLGETSISPTPAELQEIRDEEHRHFGILTEAITELGGDPTVQTPCADVSAVASMGIMQVLADPRTSMSQCLNAIATAELTDNAGWELLIDLADELGHEDLSERFTEALTNEQQHLLNVQTWLADRIMARL